MVVNHLKCCGFGAVSMSDLPSRIIENMSSVDFVKRSFPMLTDWGVFDEDVLVHSIGCSAWNALGHELGRMAVVECPVPMTHGADIRADSTWFCRDQRKPEVLIEFERYDGTSKGIKKLEEKMKNLIESAMRWDHSPSVLVLSAWNKGIVSAPDTQLFQKLCRDGFKSSLGTQIPPLKNTSVLFSRFFFEIKPNSGLFLSQTKCVRLM